MATLTSTSTIHNLLLGAENITEAVIKNNQGKFLNFDIVAHIGGTTPGTMIDRKVFFTLMVEEARFLLSNPAYLPWFDDGNRAIRVTGEGIFIIPTYRAIDGEAETVRISMRHQEFFPILESALAIPEGTSIEFVNEIRRSAKMAVPKFDECWDDASTEILRNNREKITRCVDRVRAIAKNSSAGQDDPMTASFYKDGPRDLYWCIVNKNGKRVMNGGIIFHGDDETGEYSIHT